MSREVSYCEFCGHNHYLHDLQEVFICAHCKDGVMEQEGDKTKSDCELMAEQLEKMNKRLEEMRLEFSTFNETLRVFAEKIKETKANSNA